MRVYRRRGAGISKRETLKRLGVVAAACYLAWNLPSVTGSLSFDGAPELLDKALTGAARLRLEGKLPEIKLWGEEPLSEVQEEVLRPVYEETVTFEPYIVVTEAPDMSVENEDYENSLSPEGTETAVSAPDLSQFGEPPVEATFHASDPSGYAIGGGVYIKNDSGLKLDAEKVFGMTSAFKNPAEGEPLVLIVHTHGSEAYFPDAENYYVPSDNERTEDTDFNVVRVGDELKRSLEALGISVLHDRNIYDSPSYTGSYTRSLEAVTKAVKAHPSIQIVFDVHRDSISRDGVTYKAVAEVGEGMKAAQMMFVVGTDALGLSHDGWKSNLSFSMKLQEKLDAAYPDLMRPINLRKERFNQHATAGSLIIEVGSSGNSLDEALLSVRLFAAVAGPEILAMSGG